MSSLTVHYFVPPTEEEEEELIKYMGDEIRKELDLIVAEAIEEGINIEEISRFELMEI